MEVKKTLDKRSVTARTSWSSPNTRPAKRNSRGLLWSIK